MKNFPFLSIAQAMLLLRVAIAVMFMAHAIVHAAKGWFVGEHGAGGVEYSIVLFVACVVIAASDRGRAATRLA